MCNNNLIDKINNVMQSNYKDIYNIFCSKIYKFIPYSDKEDYFNTAYIDFIRSKSVSEGLIDPETITVPYLNTVLYQIAKYRFLNECKNNAKLRESVSKELEFIKDASSYNKKNNFVNSTLEVNEFLSSLTDDELKVYRSLINEESYRELLERHDFDHDKNYFKSKKTLMEKAQKYFKD